MMNIRSYVRKKLPDYNYLTSAYAATETSVKNTYDLFKKISAKRLMYTDRRHLK